MKMKVQLVVCAEDGREEEVHEIAVVEKPHERIEHLGLTLAEAKSILKTLQQHLIERQATAFVAAVRLKNSAASIQLKPLRLGVYWTKGWCHHLQPEERP